MPPGSDGINGCGRGGRLLRALALAGLLVSVIAAPAAAQMFTDQPPPVPPALVPEPSGGEITLAPPSGPSIPRPPAPSTQPSIAAAPPLVSPPGAPTPGPAAP